MLGIKEKIKKNDKLYVIIRCIKNSDDPDLVKLIKGYYGEDHNYCSVLVKHNGDKFPDITIYHIKRYLKTKDNAGFGAVLHWTLELLNIADRYGLIPVVEWCSTMLYHDIEMDALTENVFEYYFDPVSEIDYREIKNCRNVVETSMWFGDYLMKNGDHNGYELEQCKFKRLGYLYKKYIHLNENTKDYIEENLRKILKKGRILGVHARGTDFANGFANHPVIIAPEEYVARAKEFFANSQYDHIFLATDDESILKIFRKEFNDSLLYYTDVIRSTGSIGSPHTSNSRTLHHYKLGLEVLRDIYSLANCDALLCGLSQVSIAAQYVNIALNRKFETIVVLNNGIHSSAF